MTAIWNPFLRFASLLLVILFAQSPALAQQENGIAVTAIALTLNGRTTYQYRLTNAGTQRVVALIVGHDHRLGVSELTQYPDGWSFNGGMVAGTVLSPSAWSPVVVATEESSAIELEWRNDGSGDVLPGQSLAGFAVVVAGASPQYLFAHWTALLANGEVAHGLLTQSGPPRISQIAARSLAGTGAVSVSVGDRPVADGASISAPLGAGGPWTTSHRLQPRPGKYFRAKARQR